MKKVSIIIPVYNVSEYIIECLESVESQIYRNIECILVDDCSTDNSVELIKDYLDNYKGDICFKLIRHVKNGGLSAARNTGLKSFCGDYLFFLDSDDKLYPNSISSLIEIANQYNQFDIIVGKVYSSNEFYNHLLNFKDSAFPIYLDNAKIIKDEFLIHIPVVAWNKLYNKDFLLKNNLFFIEGVIFEDVIWHFELSKHISSIGFTEEVIYYYRYNENSTMNSIEKEKGRIKSNYVLLDHLFSKMETPFLYMEFLFILKLFVQFKDLDVSVKNKPIQKEFVQKSFELLNEIKMPKSLRIIFNILYRNFFNNKFVWNKLLGVVYKLARRQSVLLTRKSN